MAASWTNDFLIAVSLGQVPGYRRVSALGNNPDVDTGSVEDVWPLGGLYPYLTAATAQEILSSSASDAAAGTGARTVQVNGLDDAFVEVTQTVTLNGVTPVALATPLFRINSMLIMSAGSGQTNAGTITLRDAGGGAARSVIPTGTGTGGISRQAIFTVPDGHTMLVTSQFFGINRVTGVGRFATFANYVRSSAGFYRTPLELSISDVTPYRHEGFMPIVVREKNDYAIRCTLVSTDSTDITAGFEAVLKDNEVD